MRTGTTSKDYPIRLAGHSLVGEGAAFLQDRCVEEQCPLKPRGSMPGSDRAGQFCGGHARCACGAQSGHLPSGGKRRAWHKDHKREVAESAPSV